MDMIRSFDAVAARAGDDTFLRHQGRGLTYAQAQDASRRAAAVLHAHGVRAGDRVALMCFNTPSFVHLLFGAWRLGAVVVPVNHKMQAPEVDHVLEHSGARLCVFDGALAPVTRRLAARTPLLTTGAPCAGIPDADAALERAEPRASVALDEDAPAEILYTSGTTGRPKGCVHTHRNVVLTAMTVALALSLTREDRTLLAVPLWHSSPLNNWLMGTAYVGGRVVLQREYEPVEFLRTAARERITVSFGPPVVYTAPLAAVPDLTRYDLSAARAWVYGGGPIGPDVARRLMDAYRTDRFYQVYGMTETGPLGTALHPGEQLRKAGSIGRTGMPGVDLRLVGEDGADAAPGAVGEIWLRTEATMRGYLDAPDATAEVFAPGGWYRTGDLARADEDGYLFVVDRAKDMIITGGENVYSKEVEDALTAHPHVAEAAVVGRPHPEWGETVVAYVVRAAGTALDHTGLRAHLADRIAGYKIPREVRFVDALPRTPTGKLQKHLLRARER